MRGLKSLSSGRGITLIEMLTVISIVAIMAAVAVPMFGSVTKSSRVSAEINGLLGDIQLARAEAIKESQTVTICASADGASCSDSNSWQTGWIVFTDLGADQAVDNANDTVWRIQSSFPSNYYLVSNTGVYAISFNPEGFAYQPPSAAPGNGLLNNMTFILHDPATNAAFTRCLRVSAIGATQIVLPPASGCS